jgi:RNA polymerase sigma-70 factor (ECF subfamily)
MEQGKDEKDAASVRLMERLQQGDRDAFTELVDMWVPTVGVYAKRRGFDDVTCDDIAQETFLAVLQNAKRFDLDRGFRGWLFRIAHNKAEDQRRAKNRRREISYDHNIVEKGKLDDNDIIKSEELGIIAECVAMLPDKLQVVFDLRCYGELTFAEIALQLAIPLGTAQTRYFRAVANLEKCAKNKSS